MYCAPLHASPRLNCSAHAFPLIRRCGAEAAVHDRFVEEGVHANGGFNHPVATRIVAGRAAGEKWSAGFVGVIMTFAAVPRTSVAEEKLLCSYFL